MKTPSLNQRTFFKLTAAGAAACLARGPAALIAGAGEKKKIPVALQLYSVREECAKDLEGTIAAVGKMGYQGAEFAGYHGRNAKTLRKLLDDAALKSCGTHLGLATLLGDKH